MEIKTSVEYDSVYLYIDNKKYFNFGTIHDDLLYLWYISKNDNCDTKESFVEYLVYEYFKSCQDDYKNNRNGAVDYYYIDYIELSDDDYKNIYDCLLATLSWFL